MNSLLLHLRSHDFVNLHPSQRQFDQSEGVGGRAARASSSVRGLEKFLPRTVPLFRITRPNELFWFSGPFQKWNGTFWHNFCSSIGPAPPIQP